MPQQCLHCPPIQILSHVFSVHADSGTAGLSRARAKHGLLCTRLSLNYHKGAYMTKSRIQIPQQY